MLNVVLSNFFILPEFDEFAEALFGQLSVEIEEETEITDLAIRANEDLGKNYFKDVSEVAKECLPLFKAKINEFLGISVPDDIKMEFPNLQELKIGRAHV